MKKHSTIIMVLFFFMGLLVLLYPSISEFHNQKVQSKEIADYEYILEEIEEKNYDNIFQEADEYNEKLRNLVDQFIDYRDLENYNEVLNINNRGMMGYISIEKIKVELPIFHGTSEKTLSNAAGHLEGTSFPVGGKGTHSAISAHRGLASATLFTNLDKLEIGDTFTITVLDRLITYAIDQILIVDPKDTSALEINDNEDYVTLITCTPYAINTHRLLVRGERIDTDEYLATINNSNLDNKKESVNYLFIFIIVVIIVLIVIFIFKKVRRRRRKWKIK